MRFDYMQIIEAVLNKVRTHTPTLPILTEFHFNRKCRRPRERILFHNGLPYTNTTIPTNPSSRDSCLYDFIIIIGNEIYSCVELKISETRKRPGKSKNREIPTCVSENVCRAATAYRGRNLSHLRETREALFQSSKHHKL